MNQDPIIAAIRASRAKLLTEAGGDLRWFMDRVREHERRCPKRFFTPDEWERVRTASQGRLPTEWLYDDPIVDEVRAARERVQSAGANRSAG